MTTKQGEDEKLFVILMILEMYFSKHSYLLIQYVEETLLSLLS